jgi:hypothetical protein
MSTQRPSQDAAADPDRITVPMPADLLAALDRFISEENGVLARPDALRAAFREWAIGRGYLPTISPDEGKRPDELNAGNDG